MLKQVIEKTVKDFILLAEPVHTEKWQGENIKDRPEAAMMEQLLVRLRSPVPKDLSDIGANLPWAEKHFLQDRISGEPKNPGETWKEWPWGLTADDHRDAGGQFNHSYAERYWPKHANMTHHGLIKGHHGLQTISGIRYPYGDLNDVVELLKREPDTRQAYLPVFFPEDTGAIHGGRIPCSIGYHFIHRGGFLHLIYQLRSCDVYRHFRDDVYLTCRLLQWVADQVGMQTGLLDMHITSLHCFTNDFRGLQK